MGGALRHFWWILCLFAVTGAGAGYWAASTRPPTYQATALLSLDTTQNISQGFDTALQADQFQSQRYIQLATSRAVLDKSCVAAKVHCDSTSLAPRVSATNSRTTGIIQISVTARTATEAASLSNAIAQQVMAQNRAQIDARIDPTRQYLQNDLKLQEDHVQAIRNQLTVVQRSIATEGSIANQSAPLLAELSQAQSQATVTYAKLEDLDVQKSRLLNALSIQQQAVPPSRPIDPNPPLYVLGGFVGGLLLGFLAALLAERLDDRIRDSAHLADATGTHFVLEMSKGGGNQPQHLEQEAASYALAHASLVARREGVRSVLVVAATLGDPVADVGVGLARAAADLGERVLVIQADRRSGVGQEAVSRSFGPGRAARVVVEATEHEDEDRQTDLPSPDGFDLIVSCTPPPGYSSDAMAVVSATDVAVVVATRGRTRFRDARWTAELLRHTGVRVSGAILLGRNGSRRRPPARLAPLPGPDQDSGQPPGAQPGDRQEAVGRTGLRRQVTAHSAARHS